MRSSIDSWSRSRDDVARTDRPYVDPALRSGQRAARHWTNDASVDSGPSRPRDSTPELQKMIGGHASLVHSRQIQPMRGHPGAGVRGPLPYRSGAGWLAAVLLRGGSRLPRRQRGGWVRLDRKP
jgi:hypothetical protein